MCTVCMDKSVGKSEDGCPDRAFGRPTLHTTYVWCIRVVYPYLVRYDVHSKHTRELESGVPSSYILLLLVE